MAKKRFDTNFFERYARITLASLLGERYGYLLNEDRPDLQMDDRSLGIEVTRAMHESKDAANRLLKGMAGLELSGEDREEMKQIISSGYGYGLQDGKYIGHLEYDYWALALPLKRIIASKVEKVGSGFYGDFDEYGLYIFCRDNLSEEEVLLTIEYMSDLQRNLDIKYSTLYLSLLDRLYVCDLRDADRIVRKTICTSHRISRRMCRKFFSEALDTTCSPQASGR